MAGVGPRAGRRQRDDGCRPGGGEPQLWQRLHDVDPGHLWWIRSQLREMLVADVRARLRRSWLERGATEAELGWIATAFDPSVLTIGFARRVPTYKRLTLMLRDPERLERLLLDESRPVQLIVAGKSHPADDGGKALIQQVVKFADRPEVRHRIAFLPDYDMSMARLLYWGCDVAQQPVASAGSLWHVGDEERAQRRAEPLDPRRLVGRVVRRRKRLGNPDCRRCHRRGPP